MNAIYHDYVSQCPICGRRFQTMLFANLHAETFHAPPPSPEQQQFERLIRDQWNAALNKLDAAPAPDARAGAGEGER